MKPQRTRSMSYAPESIQARCERPEWILCRNQDQFPIPDNDVLRLWTEQGRVRPTDYLFNPRLDTCVQAREVADLDVIFQRTTARRLAALTRALGLVRREAVFLAPLAGSVMLLTAVIWI